MRYLRSIMGGALLCGAAFASAQTMYRCGNTFSQQPCGQDAKEVAIQGVPQPRKVPPMPVDEPASPETLAAARTMCEAAITGQLKDPASAKFDAPIRMGLRRTPDGVILRDYTVYVNAKNSFGGYTGAKRWTCSLNAAETSVLWSGGRD